MDARRIGADYPVQVVLGGAFVAALLVTVGYALTGESTATAIRLAALTTVLFGFAAAFAAGPLAERYL